MSCKLALLSLIVLVTSTVHATDLPHSTCAVWLANKQQTSVTAATGHRLTAEHTKALKASMTKRGKIITPVDGSHNIAGSSGHPGACGIPYDGSDKIACLWTGFGGQVFNQFTPGWLTAASPSNCLRTIVVAANGQVTTGTVAEGCAFAGPGQFLSLDEGCSGIFLSDGMLHDLHLDGATAFKVDKWGFYPQDPY